MGKAPSDQTIRPAERDSRQLTDGHGPAPGKTVDLPRLLTELETVLGAHSSACGQACARAISALSSRPSMEPQPPSLSPQEQPFYPILMDALATASHPLGKLLHASSPLLPWAPTKTQSIPTDVARQLAVVHFIGPEAMIPHDEVRVGFYLQRPGYHYPAHSHAAEELYFILSGHAHWQVADGPSRRLPPESYSHHQAWDSHAMTTSQEPLVAVWAWSGDIGFGSYKMD